MAPPGLGLNFWIAFLNFSLHMFGRSQGYGSQSFSFFIPLLFLYAVQNSISGNQTNELWVGGGEVGLGMGKCLQIALVGSDMWGSRVEGRGSVEGAWLLQTWKANSSASRCTGCSWGMPHNPHMPTQFANINRRVIKLQGTLVSTLMSPFFFQPLVSGLSYRIEGRILNLFVEHKGERNPGDLKHAG